MFNAALFTMVKTWRHPKCHLIEDWIKKMEYINTMKCCSAIRKDELLPFVTTWMDLENMLTKIVETEKVKNHMIPLICGV